MFPGFGSYIHEKSSDLMVKSQQTNEHASCVYIHICIEKFEYIMFKPNEQQTQCLTSRMRYDVNC